MSENKNCLNCIHRQKIAGDAHSRCKATWEKEDFVEKTKKITISWNQWSSGFPNNFDPVWIKKCSKHELRN